jgi:isocitrate dehydrogenase
MLLLAAEIPGLELADEAFKHYGAPGVIIAILTAAVWYLYKDNKRIQEKRVSEAKEAAEKSQALAKEMAGTMADATVSMKGLVSTVDHVREILLLTKGR